MLSVAPTSRTVEPDGEPRKRAESVRNLNNSLAGQLPPTMLYEEGAVFVVSSAASMDRRLPSRLEALIGLFGVCEEIG